ncbi:hypothetical protein PFICI_14198 [Pestalotiopsis fici W106-1]|uniref:Thioredoxin-like fold domain-containing protein n=1 Tax=Pestalotiopsis fici (strain W106-1 / CGMCC3.15140) TaxID=1229662 RepID=W3WMG3_PESFW|nr:uncharacterized protein PFICI_14198 [Pestalotiopsis fici W106-1]ETS74332.1 hypothetical protein PFICI_14198 [Pestalotiopsis fici W106-1]
MSTSDNKPSITIFRGWKDFGKHVWSPFVIKLEARMRFAGIKYAVDVGSPKTGPKGKIPYVECKQNKSLDGGPAADDYEEVQQLADSTLIIKTLVQWGELPDLNAALSSTDGAKDMALRALLEDKLYFYHMWERWILNYYTMRDHALGAIPYPVRIVVGLIIYRGQLSTLHGQGTGRYSGQEIAAFRYEIWESINALLLEARRQQQQQQQAQSASTASTVGAQADQQLPPPPPFWVLGRDQPTEADATLFAFIVSVLISTAAPDSQRVVRAFPVILDYAQRIQDQYFPDYEKWSV